MGRFSLPDSLTWCPASRRRLGRFLAVGSSLVLAGSLAVGMSASAPAMASGGPSLMPDAGQNSPDETHAP